MFPLRKEIIAFLVRLATSALVLMVSVGWVSPDNPKNTFLRALLVSVGLSVVSYITLARFLWFLLLPWLAYATVWLTVIVGAYDLRFFTALLLALVLTLLSFLVSLFFGIRRI